MIMKKIPKKIIQDTTLMRRFEFSESTSNKFWEVEVKGKTLNVTFGKIGTKGQSKPKDFATPEKAKAELEKLIKEKTGKGYVEVGGKAVKEAKPAAKPAAGKKANAGGMGEELSNEEMKEKAKKVLLMLAGGQWELARRLLEAAQDEHWLFEELLEGCSINRGKPNPSALMQNTGDNLAELMMMEILSHLPKDLKAFQNLRKEIGIRGWILSKYWKEVENDKFRWINYSDPGNFNEHWYEERETEIAKVEKECEARGKALKKQWKKEENLGKGVNIEMVLIPAGKFMMGSPENEKFRYLNEPQHQVTLTKSYYMGKYAVTQEQWEQVMGNNPSSYKGAKLPVNKINWKDCQAFIQKLNAKTNGDYRLPTEAEWEYACKAGTTTAYSFGDRITPKDANYKGSKIRKPIAVGSYKPNGFGLYDMHGNVWEWCENWKSDYPREPITDPKGPADGKIHLFRGGAFDFVASLNRSAVRSYYVSLDHTNSYGFRLVRTK